MSQLLRPARRPVDAIVTVPGSKSIANRALVCAALADGDSELTGVPPGDDTAAMVRCLAGLGATIALASDRARTNGTGGRLSPGGHALDAGLAGTTSRFVTAVAALAADPVTIDGAAPLRLRPMGPLHDALRTLGATVTSPEPGLLPVTVSGPLRRGGTIALRGDISSQYLTALMLIAPLLDGGLRLELTTPLVSAPYVELTARVMAAFGLGGVTVEPSTVVVPPGRYHPTSFEVEPDASSASYPWAIAAVAGGRVTVAGLTSGSWQGDVAAAALLGRMGCTVTDDPEGLTVAREPTVPLRGVEVDMREVSDLVPTVAAVAAVADSPTTITGVGFIRAKESDRLGDLAAELTKLGAAVEVQADGLRIEPGSGLHAADLETHHDHRLAMAFGVLAAAVDGIAIDDPGVVAKSWPGFWDVRDAIIGTAT